MIKSFAPTTFVDAAERFPEEGLRSGFESRDHKNGRRSHGRVQFPGGLWSTAEIVLLTDEMNHGRVRLHVLVDWSSVEVFAGAGESVITDQIFPSPESNGVALYARGGTARLRSLDAWALRSAWNAEKR